MEPWVLFSLSLLVYLYLEVSGAEDGAQDQRVLAGQGRRRRRGPGEPGGPEFNQRQRGELEWGKRRKAGGQGRARGNRDNQRSQTPLGLTRLGSLPANAGGDDGASIFIESYKSVDERQSNYNVIPGKKGQCVYQGITMFEQAVWSPKPCVTCLCSGGQVLCDEVTCPRQRCHFPYTPSGECCPVCMDTASHGDVLDFSGDSPVAYDPDSVTPDLDPILDPVVTRTKAEIELLNREEEERLLKKEKRRKKQKEEAERQRRRQEERRHEEERLRMEKEERRQEEARRLKEEVAMKERERKLEEERRRHEEELKEKLRELAELEEEEEEEEEEEMEWLLRGDVFQMFPDEPTEEDLLPPPLATPTDREEEDGKGVVVRRPGITLPLGCDISDVTVTCENAKLTNFPPLNIPELKSLSLEGNSITIIPVGAFNGIPNLESINLGKNRLTTAGIAPHTFKGLKFLSRLYLDNNLLETVLPDFPSTLQELKINENHLKGIEENSFQGLSDLLTLELEGNLLSEGNVDPLAFRPLSQLSYLRLGRNHFRTVPQGLPPSLLEIYLENNLIEEISDSVFNQTTNLNVISLRHNRLEESRIAPLAWINHKNLESIDLAYNRLYLVPSYLPRVLVHLVLVGNQIERIPGFVFAHMEPGIEYLYLSYNKLDGEGVEPQSFLGTYTSMTELCLDHNQLVTVPPGINQMSTLHFLRLNNNKIRTFAEDAICDPQNDEDANILTLRLENNYIDPRKISSTAFSCVRSYSSIVLKPQWTK
ncbi:extracellular matrix protein 2-like isoform X2 [Salvelinus fontinalis]|uniref:extracellular matrix protein 2-like isoform X2 n=1 Tax=Salvelinus fontinalis TaxID=8038 RepID=UPI0024866F06|nr:extracellular matrix protein 2-like isoform X2 [Salvelinus fontinalis]